MRNIYYLCAPNRHLAEHSPYFEAMKRKDMEVLPNLDTHPAIITVLKMGAAQHFLHNYQLTSSSEERTQILQPTLEINAGRRSASTNSEMNLRFVSEAATSVFNIIQEL
ncbi:hypothetical protein QQF64_025462 [Cirrhinus molitorella]|uniref:Uncharacterized protein n=1 Tax=Cirrhinus molitorella TaxID=172907 RepID=A0ABR3NP38_9TELE